MKWILLVVMEIVFVLLISGCTQMPTCNPPYIVHETGCCLDQNNNSICDTDEGATQPTTYCGDGVCQSDESCSTCSSDCGVCPSPVTSTYEAIGKLEDDTRVSQRWEDEATRRNCGTRYTDVRNAAIFTTRITFSQNIIDCTTSNQFSKVKSEIERMGLSEQKDMFSYMFSCDEALIDIFNKAIRGYDTGFQAPLDDTCFDCDEIYAIYLGCVDSDWTEDAWVPQKLSIEALAVVDAETGIVYW